MTSQTNTITTISTLIIGAALALYGVAFIANAVVGY